MVVTGRDISAEDVERFFGRDGAHQFTRFCNSIVWADACVVPSLTERVNAQDGGIDASAEIELPQERPSGRILRSGHNVLQYKQRDPSRDRDKVEKQLLKNVKGAARAVEDATGTQVDCYVLMANIDFTHGEKKASLTPKRTRRPRRATTSLSRKPKILKALREAILEGCDRKIDVIILGAGELAAVLRDSPSIWAAFWPDTGFERWGDRLELNLKRTDHPAKEVIGRQCDVDFGRQQLDDMGVRVIGIVGPQGSGKTRVALEVLRDKTADVLVASSGANVSMGLIAQLVRTHWKGILLVEDPPLERLRELVEATVAAQFRMMFTLPVLDGALPNASTDSRVRVRHLKPLAPDDARKLLENANPGMSYALAHWVLEQAGGNALMILQAAAMGSRLHAEHRSLVTEMSDAVLNRVLQRGGQCAVQALSVVSVMGTLVVEGDSTSDLNTVLRIAGEGLSPTSFSSALRALISQGIVFVRDRVAEVTLPYVANRLASDVFRFAPQRVHELACSLTPIALTSLLERLRLLPDEDTGYFWRHVLSDVGPLADDAQLLASSFLLQLAASAQPETVATRLVTALAALAESANGEPTFVQGSVIIVLASLLSRRSSCLNSIEALAYIAELTKSDSNNEGRRAFAHALNALHSQVAAPLSERLKKLREMLAAAPRSTLRAIILEGIAKACDRHGSIALRETRGANPPDALPRITWGDVARYQEELIGMLFAYGEDTDDICYKTAISLLPEAIGHYGYIGNPKFAADAFKRLLRLGRGGTQQLVIPEVVGKMMHLAKNYVDVGSRDGVQTGVRDDLLDAAHRLRRAAVELREASYETRLRYWAAPPHDDGYERVDLDGGGNDYRINIELGKLAAEAVVSPELINANVTRWISSEEPSGASQFMFALGKADVEGFFLSMALNLVRRYPEWRGFISYCSGLATHGQGCADLLADLAKEDIAFPSNQIVLALAESRYSQTPSIVREFLTDGRITTRFAVHALRQLTLRTMPHLPNGTIAVLDEIAIADSEQIAQVFDVVALLVLGSHELPSECVRLVWRLLQTPIPCVGQQDYDIDCVAAYVCKLDVEQALKVFARGLQKPQYGEWDPIGLHRPSEFWKALHELAPREAIRILLCATQPRNYYLDSMHLLDPVVDEAVLRDLLAKQPGLLPRVVTFLPKDQELTWRIALETLSVTIDADVQHGFEEAMLSTSFGAVDALADGLRIRAEIAERVLAELPLSSATITVVRGLVGKLRRESEAYKRGDWWPRSNADGYFANSSEINAVQAASSRKLESSHRR